ncbi:MAG: hypothetical protein WAL90_10885 [Desulfobacterales bacterium]
MEVVTGKRYAVITGDIVGSRKFSEEARRDLHAVMMAGAGALCAVFGEAVPLELETFRGDAWQVVIAEPARALRIGSFYRAFLRAGISGVKADTRLAIGVGSVDFIPAGKVSSGDGEAYRLSGGLLERMPRQQRLAFGFAAPRADDLLAALDTVIQLMDVLASGWSAKQAQAVTGALQGWTQEKIATACWSRPITQQAVAQHLDRAGWHAFERGLVFFEDTLSALLNTHDPAGHPNE